MEIGLERCRRRLLSIGRAGLLGVSDPAVAVNVIRHVAGHPSTLNAKS
jgi:hypothetical protein